MMARTRPLTTVTFTWTGNGGEERGGGKRESHHAVAAAAGCSLSLAGSCQRTVKAEVRAGYSTL